jgi:hypothetical protein
MKNWGGGVLHGCMGAWLHGSWNGCPVPGLINQTVKHLQLIEKPMTNDQ